MATGKPFGKSDKMLAGKGRLFCSKFALHILTVYNFSHPLSSDYTCTSITLSSDNPGLYITDFKTPCKNVLPLFLDL